MQSYIPYVTPSECRKLHLEDINYIRRISRKVEICSRSGSYYLYESFDRVTGYLEGPFFSCLKGLIINFDRVESMCEQSVFFENGDVLRLGRDSYVKTRQTYAIYLKNPCNYPGFVVKY